MNQTNSIDFRSKSQKVFDHLFFFSFRNEVSISELEFYCRESSFEITSFVQ